MGDSRHKNSPLPSEEEDDVTDEFVDRARSKLAENKRLNRISGAAEGDAKYLIASHAALAREVSKLTGKEFGEKALANIIGPVRDGSKWDRQTRSTYVKPIAKALRFEPTAMIEVPLSRATILGWLARLSDEKFAKFEEALEEARRADSK